MKTNFTLIIPTYNRANYLEKMLNYYLDIQSVTFDIIICDSSHKKQTSKYFQLDNVSYNYFENLSYAEKMLKGLSLASTPYIFIGTDDDYLIPDTLYSMQNILDQKEVNSVDGTTMSFNNELELSPSGFYLKSNISSQSIEERLSLFFKNYYPIYYSGYKKSFLEDFFLILNEYKINNIYLPEYLLAAMSLIRGTHVSLDKIYFIRNAISSPENPHQRANKYRIENIYNINDSEYEKLITAISKYLLKHSDYDYLSAKKIVGDIIENDLIKSRIKKKHKYYDIRQSNFIERGIKAFLCKIFNSIICEYINKKHWQYRRNILIRKTKSCKGYPFYNDDVHQEWLKIKKNIKSD